ncbi:MAG TPA: hypothetical protein VHU91_10385, partial [Mycobacteriales bacterium]|nr:hypothetical protein [Mycobacteriales bacterium]
TEAGERVALNYRDGVHLIELAPVTNADDVSRVVLGRLGMRESNLLENPQRASHRNVLTQLADALRDKQTLLLFDNCEHLIEPVARLVELLLANSPGLRVIATSREPLAIFGEALHPVPPLSQPSADASPADALESHAVQLFADRAASVRPGFAVDDSTIASVVEICRRLDGLPLAIELAAARLRTLSVGHIAERLSDRFRLLNVGSRTAMPRHQTLRAVVEWSWDLLTDDERRVAERLAVFPAGVTRDSCAAVCPDLRLDPNDPDDVLDLLGALADKSLLQQVRTGDKPRYRMLETIREYGIERLDERGERLRVQAWHSAYFLALAQEADPHLRSFEQLVWLERLNTEHDNLLAALRYAIEAGDADAAVRLAAALTWYWVLLGSHAEAATWSKQALGVPGETDDEARAVTIAAYGINVAISGEFDTAESLIPGLLELAERLDARSGNPVIAVIRPGVAMAAGQEDTAIAEITALLDHPDRWTRAMLRAFRSAVYENCGDFERMRDDREAALAEFREIGDRWGMATTLSELVIVWQVDPRRLTDAIAACEDALRLSRELGANGDISQLLVRLADLHLRSGNRRTAEANLIEADTVVARFGSVESVAMVRAGWIGWHYAGGGMAEARRLAELTIAEADQISSGFPHLRSVLRANAALVATAQNDAAAARAWLWEAFPIAMSTNDQPIIARVGVAAAGYLVRFGAPSLAVELLAAGAVLRGVEDATDLGIAAVTDAARAELGDEAYQAAYAKGGALNKDAALAMLEQTLEKL